MPTSAGNVDDARIDRGLGVIHDRDGRVVGEGRAKPARGGDQHRKKTRRARRKSSASHNTSTHSLSQAGPDAASKKSGARRWIVEGKDLPENACKADEAALILGVAGSREGVPCVKRFNAGDQSRSRPSQPTGGEGRRSFACGRYRPAAARARRGDWALHQRHGWPRGAGLRR